MHANLQDLASVRTVSFVGDWFGTSWSRRNVAGRDLVTYDQKREAPLAHRDQASLDRPHPSGRMPSLCGINSAVECQLPKLKVAGSNPVSRSRIQAHCRRKRPKLVRLLQHQKPAALRQTASSYEAVRRSGSAMSEVQSTMRLLGSRA